MEEFIYSSSPAHTNIIFFLLHGSVLSPLDVLGIMLSMWTAPAMSVMGKGPPYEIPD
jgi:hypothetical protein